MAVFWVVATLTTLLVLTGLATLVFVSTPSSDGSVTWYRAYKLSEETTEYLKSVGCYRGTYGRFELSIFTCQGFKGESFATLPIDAPLCFVEYDLGMEPLRVIASNADAQVLWTGENEILLTGLNGEYPERSCSSRSDYSGAALNVIRVPRFSILPEKPLYPITVEAPDVRIANLLAGVTQVGLRGIVERLALNFTSRNSYAASAQDAVNWAGDQFRRYGFNVTQQNFRSDMCNNVIAERWGTREVTPTRVVVIGAHIDSRAGSASNAVTPAPGADDNGSGSAAVLELARLISEQGFRTDADIRLCLWCGEEQGLLGSDAAANVMRQDPTVTIDAYYNADMIGYNCKGTGDKTNPVAFMAGSSSAALNTECKNTIKEYIADLNIGDTTACCSDQQSFNKYSIAASGIFECPGNGVAYPHYHAATDLPNQLDYEQVSRFSQAIFSCFLTRARPSGPL